MELCPHFEDHTQPPAWRAFYAEYAETRERIGQRVAHDAEEARQARLALAWCRANGNPHLNDNARVLEAAFTAAVEEERRTMRDEMQRTQMLWDSYYRPA